MDAREIREFEPALTGNIAGGVFFPEEAHAEPLAAVKALVARAEEHAQRDGSRQERPHSIGKP